MADWLYPTGVTDLDEGLVGTLGWRLEGTVPVARSTDGIEATGVPGNYQRAGGTLPIPDGFTGRIVWSVETSPDVFEDVAEEWIGDHWAAAGYVPDVTPGPPPIDGLRTVQFWVERNGEWLNGCKVAAKLADEGLVDGILPSLQRVEALTGAEPWPDGYAELYLWQGSRFTGGTTGEYVITVSDPSGKVEHRKVAVIPDGAGAINFEDL